MKTIIKNEVIENPSQNKLNVYLRTSKLVEQGYTVEKFDVDSIERILINHESKTISGK